jgi:hypothetical protein
MDQPNLSHSAPPEGWAVAKVRNQQVKAILKGFEQYGGLGDLVLKSLSDT